MRRFDAHLQNEACKTTPRATGWHFGNGYDVSTERAANYHRESFNLGAAGGLFAASVSCG
jgi:hypothetical protein